MDQRALDAFVGRYQLPGGGVMMISRENERLFTQVGTNPKFELFPEDEHDFFTKAFDGQFSFLTDSHGKAMELVVYEGGEIVHAKRIE